MDTPAPEWMPAECRLTYPGSVQRKAVVASGGRDHWTDESLDWHLIGTHASREAAEGKGARNRQCARLPTIDHRSNNPETDFVICAWRTNDATHDMTPEELLACCEAVIRHSPNWPVRS